MIPIKAKTKKTRDVELVDTTKRYQEDAECADADEGGSGKTSGDDDAVRDTATWCEDVAEGSAGAAFVLEGVAVLEADAPGSTASVVGLWDGVPEILGVAELDAVSLLSDRVTEVTNPICSGSAA